MKKLIGCSRAGMIIFSVILLFCPLTIQAQENESRAFERETIITAAKEIMKASRYCALITLDKSGHPQVRTMDPFMPGEDMVIWLGTNKNTRKVAEIRNDSRVTLYYEAPQGGGYVVVKGKAHLKDGPEELEKYWKEEWDEFYPDKTRSFTLIQVVPEKLEIINYKQGITGFSKTWKVPYLEF